MTNLKTTTSTEWNSLKTSLAPWADFETEYYMQVVPTSWITSYSYTYFKNFLEKRDEAMKGSYCFFVIFFIERFVENNLTSILVPW